MLTRSVNNVALLSSDTTNRLSKEMSLHSITGCSLVLYYVPSLSGVCSFCMKVWDTHFALITWQHCCLYVMSIIWQSPASASSASKSIYSQLIHFIAIRWWQHFEVCAKEGWSGGGGALIGCISWFASLSCSMYPPVTVSQIRRPTFYFFFFFPLTSWFGASSLSACLS